MKIAGGCGGRTLADRELRLRLHGSPQYHGSWIGRMVPDITVWGSSFLGECLSVFYTMQISEEYVGNSGKWLRHFK